MNAIAKQQEQQLATVTDGATILQIISRIASDPNADIEKMDRLMQMHERLAQQQALTAFNDAMSEAQREMLPISQDASNPQTRSKYASYNNLDKAIRPIYTRQGFSISYDTDESPKPEHVRVLAYAALGGYTRTYRVDMPCDGKGAKGGDVMTKTHATTGAISYGKRALLKAIFNLAEGEGDTDGNTPHERPPAPEGYERWRDDLAAVVDEGRERLMEVWKKSPMPMRSYMAKYESHAWDAMKSKSAKATA
jgi:hypothetical protein